MLSNLNIVTIVMIIILMRHDQFMSATFVANFFPVYYYFPVYSVAMLETAVVLHERSKGQTQVWFPLSLWCLSPLQVAHRKCMLIMNSFGLLWFSSLEIPIIMFKKLISHRFRSLIENVCSLWILLDCCDFHLLKFHQSCLKAYSPATDFIEFAEKN